DCWVHGEDVGKIFPVKISSTETVGELKKAIKNEKPVGFRDVDADDLDLYPFRPVDPDEDLENALKQWKLGCNARLGPRRRLSVCFPKSNVGKWLVIVSAPSSYITLYCWVRGQSTNHIFPVKISSTMTVGDLKEAIKDKKPVDFRDVDADALALYKVSHADNGDLQKTLEHLTFDDEEPLNPMAPLSSVFSDVPPRHLHIVIETP
ncbi:hypothetical protein BU15DRAFT_28414, partial [Melanogaster broomeanus]